MEKKSGQKIRYHFVIFRCISIIVLTLLTLDPSGNFTKLAYDPNNAKYRELSSYFWKTYTTYGGLWRDQPLWAYLLHHFNVTPAVMTTEGTITKGGDLFRTGGKLGWDKHVYT